jgi:hypothetical protein
MSVKNIRGAWATAEAAQNSKLATVRKRDLCLVFMMFFAPFLSLRIKPFCSTPRALHTHSRSSVEFMAPKSHRTIGPQYRFKLRMGSYLVTEHRHHRKPYLSFFAFTKSSKANWLPETNMPIHNELPMENELRTQEYCLGLRNCLDLNRHFHRENIYFTDPQIGHLTDRTVPILAGLSN